MDFLSAYRGVTIDPSLIYIEYKTAGRFYFTEDDEFLKRMKAFGRAIGAEKYPSPFDGHDLPPQTAGKIERVLDAIGDYNRLAENYLGLGWRRREAERNHSLSFDLQGVFRFASTYWTRQNARQNLHRLEQEFETGSRGAGIGRCRNELEGIFQKLMRDVMHGRPVDDDIDDKIHAYRGLLKQEGPVFIEATNANLAALAGNGARPGL